MSTKAQKLEVRNILFTAGKIETKFYESINPLKLGNIIVDNNQQNFFKFDKIIT